MAGWIRQEDVDAVRERTDLVKVVSGHLQLKKAGRDSMVGLCPFHSEKSPSFSVSPSKQLYYCFGCGEGGNVFDFVRKVEGLSFPEVVERLAAEAGVTLRYEGESRTDRAQVNRRQVLHRAIAESARLFSRMLVEGREAAEARAYVASRGISPASVERFQIGYAPGYPDFLLRRLAKTFSAEILVEAGLVAQDASGALRDRFRGRVMFPIHDLSGNAIGFGGRLLAGPGSPANAAKYVNSPDGPVYHKGTVLYNLNRAKAGLIPGARAIMVEGYTDVVALDQGGIPLAVATCGTALGEDHLRVLSRFTDKVVLAFDSDEAGARAAERAYQFHERYPVDLSVLVLPQGQDPADFVQTRGGEAFAAAAERAVPLVEYMIVRSLIGRDLADVEERARAVQTGLGIVIGLEDPVRRRAYAGVLAERVGVSVNEVLLELERLTRPMAGDAGPVRQPGRVPPNQKVEREALKLLVQSPELCAGRLGHVEPDQFATPSYRKIFELIRNDVAGSTAERVGGEVNGRARGGGPGGNGHVPTAAELVARAQQERGEQTGKLLAALAVEPLEAGDEPGPDYADRVFLRLEEFALSRRIEATRKELERLNPLTAEAEHRGLFEELIGLERARRDVRAAGERVALT